MYCKRSISPKKMYAIFFNSSGPVVQVPCPSGHTVTGWFYKNSVLKKMKEFYNKKPPSKGSSGVQLLQDNASSNKCEVVKSFYTPPHNSGGVSWFHVGRQWVCPSIRRTSVRPSIFRFRMITWVNINGFSPNLVCALILWRSDLELLMGKFHQFLKELSAQDTPIFSFLDDNFSKHQWIFTKLGLYIDIVEI